jgi:undecaprenyl phosphate N,N'-diacetylbacillosamine 1-phosphate transferase
MSAKAVAPPPGLYANAFKRLLDICLTAVLLPVALPLALVVAIAVRIALGSPILFIQERPGWRGRTIRLLKFRTMTNARLPNGELRLEGERMTRFGVLLRSTSLDELPELLNVLRGDMSLVGPRPLLMRYLPYYTEVERARFLVRPGITGLAQVSGRNDMRWDDRLALDAAYVSSLCLRTDLRILALTALRVLSRHGLQVDPGSTMLDLDAERRLRSMPENGRHA